MPLDIQSTGQATTRLREFEQAVADGKQRVRAAELAQEEAERESERLHTAMVEALAADDAAAQTAIRAERRALEGEEHGAQVEGTRLAAKRAEADLAAFLVDAYDQLMDEHTPRAVAAQERLRAALAEYADATMSGTAPRACRERCTTLPAEGPAGRASARAGVRRAQAGDQAGRGPPDPMPGAAHRGDERDRVRARQRDLMPGTSTTVEPDDHDRHEVQPATARNQPTDELARGTTSHVQDLPAAAAQSSPLCLRRVSERPVRGFGQSPGPADGSLSFTSAFATSRTSIGGRRKRAVPSASKQRW